MRYRGLWATFALVVVASFAVLGYFGHQIYLQAPPIPQRVATPDGAVLFTGEDIRTGQSVWRSMGGQEVGSVWGHGAYQAPDWSADWLHREATALLDSWSQQQFRAGYEQLPAEYQAMLKAHLKLELRTNTYDAASGTLTVSADRAAAMAQVADHYARVFGDDPGSRTLRNAYAIPANVLHDAERQRTLSAFFFWSSWACATNRPGQAITYTNNWPGEDLIDNHPTAPILLWSIVSIIALLAGVGGLTWYYAVIRDRAGHEHPAPSTDPLRGLQCTPSMRATYKYFWVVGALLVAQVLLGILTAHYGVEGNSFYGLPLAHWLPYAVTRSWHTQLGIFWIATAWLGTGLFIAPAVSGHEPKGQKLGVDFLFVCLLIIVVGALVGQWLSIQQRMGLEASYWFGHQGYEYVDLGRFWQCFLFVGLVLWLGLMVRALLPAFRQPGEHKHLLGMFVLAAAAIGLFYASGFMVGHHTNYAISEYWRWWVVHLWVEGFFEVFATVVIAFLFVRLGLLETVSATTAVLFSCSLFLLGGILGTFHHLYFTGTPVGVMALGAVFSALEVVPLVLIGYEGYEHLKLSRTRPWVSAYRWPIYYFIAVAFWNLVGAGLLGFLINPPIALYYMQGLNTTPVHGHAALFGVYGMLGIGLMLFCLKGLTTHRPWRTGALQLSFWGMNVGLALMLLLSVLPVGLLQTAASVEHGMWYARSAEFLQLPLLNTLRWLRALGDSIFAVGVLALVWFIVGLKTGWSLTPGDARDITPE